MSAVSDVLSPAAHAAGGSSGANQGPYQDALTNYCRAQGWRAPNFQIISDRRGGRTAWSCIVFVHTTEFQARFWYDGQYVGKAREDAAERALQTLGVVSPPPGSAPPASAGGAHGAAQGYTYSSQVNGTYGQSGYGSAVGANGRGAGYYGGVQ